MRVSFVGSAPRTASRIRAALLLIACGGEAPSADSAGAAASAPAASATGASATDPQAVLALGRSKYEQVCINCHMADGRGTPGVFPPLTAGSLATSDVPDVPIGIVLHGMRGPIDIDGATIESVMQPWGLLPDRDIAAILTYVRQSWGNTASPVSTEQVADVRAREGQRAEWSVAEFRERWPDAVR